MLFRSIIAIDNWVDELLLINSALNTDDEMSAVDIETLLNDIESSQLLGDGKERILVEIAAHFNSNIDPSTTSIDETQYSYEKALLLSIVENKDMIDDISDPLFEISTFTNSNITILGGIIDDASASVLFYDLVEEAVGDLFVNYGINYTSSLEDGIPWEEEILILKEINDVSGSISDSTDLANLLEKVGQSTILADDKWNILQDIVDDLSIGYSVNESNGWEVESANIVLAYEAMI